MSEWKAEVWRCDHGVTSGIPIKHEPYEEAPIIIGDDMQIGPNVTILKSTTLGARASVGAGAVVTKNVPEYPIVVGNPAQVVKYRGQGRIEVQA